MYFTYSNSHSYVRGSLGSESLNWRSAEPEVPPAECNVDPGRSQTHGVPQVPSTSVENRKVESVADHQDYVNFLHTGKEEILIHGKYCFGDRLLF